MFDDHDSLEDDYAEDYMPLDDAVALMAHGYDMHAYEGHPSLIDPLFDPYFED
jgi:hypothetical protein